MLKLNKEELQKLVNNSVSFREIGRKVNAKHRSIQNLCAKYQIDTSHFKFGNDALKLGKKLILEVIKIFNKQTNNGKVRKFAICKCICGKIIEKRYDSVQSGKVISCGCAKYCSRDGLYKELNGYYTGINDISGSYISGIKKSAKRRDIIFSLSKEYLWELYIKQNKKCALSGVEIWFGPNHSSFLTSASLDRIDSSKGYIEGNVQWIYKDLNLMKGTLQQDFFIELCIKIANYQNKSLNY